MVVTIMFIKLLAIPSSMQQKQGEVNSVLIVVMLLFKMAHNVLRLCVRAGLFARMFKVSTTTRLTQNRCYKLAAVYQAET